MKKPLNNIRAKLYAGIVCLLLIVFSVSCSKDDDPAPVAGADAEVNAWILEQMQFWYLWKDELPKSPDKNQAPEPFFKSLLSSQDRFSWIQDNYQELLNSLQGINKEAGYEYVLYQQENQAVIAQVLYIKPDSPAEAAGLKRGDVITHISEQQLTMSNYKELIKAAAENHTIRYRPLLVGEEKFDTERTLSLTTVQYTEDPNYLSKVIIQDDKKIGYFVYNLFVDGINGNPSAYDDDMEEIFAGFKASGITDLVLDLRFNSGGSESAAIKLASLIGKNVNNTKVFARRSYNDDVEQALVNDPRYGSDFLISRFTNEPANVGSLLNDGRVYILTSSRTASASELVINALKPYMEVFLIGNVTYGKNVGSISLYEENNPDNTWGMQPIVVKVYNSLDQSDYSTGFTPDVLHKDNGLYVYPLSDTREALLSLAIGQITGAASSGRRYTPDEGRPVIGHSLDQKRRGFTLTVD